MNVQVCRHESGQSMTEYALLLVLIGALAVVFLWKMGRGVNSIFSKVAQTVQQSSDAVTPIKEVKDK